MNWVFQTLHTLVDSLKNKPGKRLINEKRVERAKVLVGNKINQMTIEAIAYEAGFNRRASFYRAFKKCTSLTPNPGGIRLPSGVFRFIETKIRYAETAFYSRRNNFTAYSYKEIKQ